MSETQSKSWKDWFLSRDSAFIIDKSKQSSLLNTFNHSISADQCKSLLQDYNETVFMFRQNFGEHKVSLFHNFCSIGRTIYSSESEVGFIQGIGE